MSELLVQPGHWNSIVAGEVESFLCSVCILIGLTPKRKDFANRVHDDIHGSFNPYNDVNYKNSIENCGKMPPSFVLGSLIMKHCNSEQKKQLKIWYTELLAMEPMDDVNPMIKMMLPELSNTINKF
jgi:hypothetical protein